MTAHLARISRPYRRTARYGHATGMVMTRESRLLDELQVQRMLYSDYNEALGIALDSSYGHYLEGVRSAADIGNGLMRSIENEYSFLDDACGGTPVSEFMHLKYDFHNLRVMMKRRYLGEAGPEEPFASLGKVNLEDIKRGLEGSGAAGVPPYITTAIGRVDAIAEGGKVDAQGIDSIIDRAFLERRLAIAGEEGSRTMEAFCRAAIDVANVIILLRGISLGKEEAFYEASFADGGKLKEKELLSLSRSPFPEVAARLLNTQYGRIVSEAVNGEDRVRLTSLDRASDDFLMESVRPFSLISVGPERIIRYMMARESEVVVLRTILVGKISGVPTGTIETRLPMAYRKSSVV